jgi:hypothetical protein
MTEAQLWIAKTQTWRIAAQTARDLWTEDQLLWLAARIDGGVGGRWVPRSVRRNQRPSTRRKGRSERDPSGAAPRPGEGVSSIDTLY